MTTLASALQIISDCSTLDNTTLESNNCMKWANLYTCTF